MTLAIPYSGTLTITANVQRGNPMMMYLTNQVGYEGLAYSNKNMVWEDFYSLRTTAFQHSGHIDKGTYYFVMRDNHLGVLSAKSSDVSLKVHLEP